eukprot:TRINITY_DN11788_c0_g1_i1.p1 TRINITY_DN11788_c0_g1~~TRINITY_DN11788_c0_g1_i1.p1  ORF type:complete len:598 (+),score=122.51 TRINITY_DN11788_c0_g1_i1:54-1796(+)
MSATAGAACWAELVKRAEEDGGKTEEELVLSSLAELKQMFASYGFDTLSAARAEVHWQVLQSTHASVRAREYRNELRAQQDAFAGAVASTPARAAEPADPVLPAPPSPAVPTPSPRRASAPGAPSPSRSRCSGSPARRLGSMDGVRRPASLREMRLTRSPARSEYPVQHDSQFKVDVSLPQVPHLSRRALLTHDGEARGQNPNTIGGPSVVPSPRRMFGTEAARSADPNSCAPQREQKRTVAVGTASPFRQRVTAAGSDPNVSSTFRTSPAARGVRAVASPIADHDKRCRSPTDPRREQQPASPAGLRRVACRAAGSALNNLLPTEAGTVKTGGVSVGGARPAADIGGSNPNPTGTAPEALATGARKRRSDPPKERTERPPRFDSGPPEVGVVPGTHAWEASAARDREKRRTRPGGYEAFSNPNEVGAPPPQGLRFIGGQRLTSGPPDAGVFTQVKTQPAGGSRDPGVPCDPNSMGSAGARRIVHPNGPSDTWGGVAGAEPRSVPQARPSQRRHFGEAERADMPPSPAPRTNCPVQRVGPAAVGAVSPPRMVRAEPRTRAFSPAREYTARFVPSISARLV